MPYNKQNQQTKLIRMGPEKKKKCDLYHSICFALLNSLQTSRINPRAIQHCFSYRFLNGQIALLSHFIEAKMERERKGEWLVHKAISQQCLELEPRSFDTESKPVHGKKDSPWSTVKGI